MATEEGAIKIPKRRRQQKNKQAHLPSSLASSFFTLRGTTYFQYNLASLRVISKQNQS
jgi:hypothetical protein